MHLGSLSIQRRQTIENCRVLGAIKVLFPDRSFPNRFFYHGGCSEPSAHSLLLPLHGDLHPPAPPDAPQLNEHRGQSPGHGSSTDAQRSCLQRCPKPWEGPFSVDGSVLHTSLLSLYLEEHQAKHRVGSGRYKSSLAGSGHKSFFGRCPEPASQPHPTLERI